MSRLRKTNNEHALLHRRISKKARRSGMTDRQFIVRSHGRVSYLRIPRYVQAAGLLVLGALVVWIVHASYAYVAYDKIVSAKDAAISARDQLNLSLRNELDNARRGFADVTDSLEKNRKGLVSLIGQYRTLDGNLRSLQKEITQIDDERRKAESEKRALAKRLAMLETHLGRITTQNQSLARELRNTGSELAGALAGKSHANKKGVTLNTRVTALQKRLGDIKESQSALLGRIADMSQSEAKRLRNVLATAGVNIDRMLRAEGVASFAQGGPFEPASRSDSNSEQDNFQLALSGANGMLDHLDGLQRIVRSLPLAPPLDYYYVSSKYGLRQDPVNSSKAMHRGVDFGAKNRATIFSTAPGKVIYAGWKGRFGRFVEIDHGNGVVTRYGHLRRIYVKRGQNVGYRVKVGQMGSSGRSTGAHLHYEIRVNKRSVDPLKFMKAGKDVFKG